MTQALKALKTLTRWACSLTVLAASASQAQVPSVGLRQIQAGGMPITLVYPTAAAPQTMTYGAFTIQVASNAAPLAAPASAASGKRALIVLSHGTAGSALPEHTLAATLALTATLACTGALAQNANAPTEAQRALLLAHYKAYGAAGDAAAILPTTTTDNWANCGANGAACQTRQELIGMLAGLKQGLPDLQWEILEMMGSGDTVIVRGQGSGTPQGTFMGTPTNGKGFKIMSIDIQTIQGGKISHTYHLEDWADAMRQLTAR